MRIILQPKREYVFKLNGNRDLPPAQQARMSYRQPNAIERRLLKRTNVKPGAVDGSGSVDVQFDVEKIFDQQDVKITGVEIEMVDEKGKSTVRAVTSGGDLARTPSKFLAAMADEAMTEIMSTDFDDEFLKNSEPASGRS